MTGWSKHAISVTFHNNYMIVANRGRGRQIQPLKVFKIDRTKPLSEKAIAILKREGDLSKNEGENSY